MVGWITKQGAVVSNWKRRWFVLKTDFLYYFKGQQVLDITVLVASTTWYLTTNQLPVHTRLTGCRANGRSSHPRLQCVAGRQLEAKQCA
jgi:hypothetical protein